MMINHFKGLDTAFESQGTRYQSMLEFYGMTGPIERWSSMAIEVGFFCFFALAAWLAMKYIRWGAR